MGDAGYRVCVAGAAQQPPDQARGVVVVDDQALAAEPRDRLQPGRHRRDHPQAGRAEDRDHRPGRHRLIHPGRRGQDARRADPPYDGDEFSTHNAFRAPGAPPIEILRQAPGKVDYLATLYGNMHRRIVAHPVFLHADNVTELAEMNFVFIAMDRGVPKRMLVDRLENYEIPFIDVGMGVSEVDGQLTGQLRITTSTSRQRDHVHDRQRIPFADTGVDDAYATNIQIAELNMLNAALAVIKWKKLCGFHLDLDLEHSSIYQIDGNTLINEDQAAARFADGEPIHGENAA